MHARLALSATSRSWVRRFSPWHANSAFRTSLGDCFVTGGQHRWSSDEFRFSAAQQRLGHTRPDILLKYYTHVLDESAEIAAETLSPQLSGKKAKKNGVKPDSGKTSKSIGSQAAASNRKRLM